MESLKAYTILTLINDGMRRDELRTEAHEKSFKLLRSLFWSRRARRESFKSARPSRLESERILRPLVSVVLSILPSKREASSFPRRIHAIGC